MKATFHAIYLLIAVILGPTLFASLKISGVMPNLFIPYLVFAGFYVSQKEAIWLGFIYGLIYDIIVGHSFGLNGIAFMFMCFLTVLFCENMIRRSNAIISVIVVAVWTVLISGVNSLFSPIAGVSYRLMVLGIEAVYNGVIMLIIYVPLNSFMRRLYNEKR